MLWLAQRHGTDVAQDTNDYAAYAMVFVYLAFSAFSLVPAHRKQSKTVRYLESRPTTTNEDVDALAPQPSEWVHYSSIRALKGVGHVSGAHYEVKTKEKVFVDL